MAAVLKLVEYVSKDTISILKVLLGMALRGELRGLVVCYRTPNGMEQTVFTGAYKSNPGKAAAASLKMSMKLLQANGEMD